MKTLKAKTLYAVLAGLCVAGAANAANIAIGDGSSRFLITTSQTWTANNVYNLRGQIYVAPGATLTIEAGTLIQSVPSDMGSLAICRGAKIIANGTPTKPIIFTSTLDTLTASHVGTGEWGNITIMGRALISASHSNVSPNNPQTYQEGDSQTPPFGTITSHTNTGSPDGLNKCVMEGLVSEGTGDPRVLYGGNDDNDDSGSISFVSLRYGGSVVGLNNELNGMSMGGVGRETDVHHIDIWNSLDDAYETWGGTVNYKYMSVWQFGDDGMDIDQGWRGKAQFGLIVAGYAAKTYQGGGVSDNLFEIDGAERNDAQPVTTGTIYNFTLIGYPGSNGQDQGIALRDEARVQFRNCLFMDVGECLIKEEPSETSDPNHTESWRYAGVDPGGPADNPITNGLLTWDECWTLPFSTSWNKSGPAAARSANHSLVSAYSQAFMQNMYQAQSDGNLMELSDSVLYRNSNAASGKQAYANTRGYNYIAGLTGNRLIDNTIDDGTGTMPIRAMTHEAPQSWTATQGGATLVFANVTALDPRATPGTAAATSARTAPADGFFTPAPFRGAFSTDVNWAKGWTAASAYGIFTAADTATTPVASGASVVTVVNFPTVSGVIYTVESSTDGKVWSPVTTIVGDGSVKTISGLTTVDPAKVYRAIAQ
jgi:hypothetical protein